MQLQTSMRDAPGTLREFETMYIMRADTTDDRVAQLNQRLRSVIEEGGGKLIRLDNWGKRRLSFEISKQWKGIYLVWRYLAPGRLIVEIMRQLRMHDAILRYLTVHVADDIRPDTRTVELDEEGFVAAGRVGPDEEEIATGVAERTGAEEEVAEVAKVEEREEAATDGPAAVEAASSEAASPDEVNNTQDSASKDETPPTPE